MHSILVIIVLTMCSLMFFLEREHKFCIMLVYTICFSNVKVFSGFDVLVNPVTLCFFSELANWNSIYPVLKKHRILLLETVMIISVAVLIAYSHNCRTVNNIIRVIITVLLKKYFVVIYGFICTLHIRNLKKTADVVYVSLLILTLFGIINFIQGRAMFIDWALSGGGSLNARLQDMGDRYADASRFRVQAMFANAFCYGYTCIVILLFFLYLWKEKIIDRNKMVIASLCSLFGIVTCASRTVLLCSVIGVVAFGYRFYGLKRYVGYLFSIPVLLILLYLLVPSIKDRVDFLFSAFDMESSIGGSSISMRLTQLETVWGYITDNIWLGNGWGFFSIDLNFLSGRSDDADLHGMESVIFMLLIESGIVGLLFYLFFWLSLLVVAWKNRNKNEGALALSLVVIYLSFSIMTGELNSWVITLLLFGCMWARMIRLERFTKIRKIILTRT